MKRTPSKKALLLFAAVVAASTGYAEAPATAASAGEELSLSDLLNIKLQTGSFLELDLAKSPLSMTVIGKDKIELAGARHLSEVLEIYVPGFQYMFNKWNGAIWGMRGVANDRNSKFIFLVNGHKMNTEARDGAFQETELGLLGDIERVEVLRGPAGLVYGSGAIAGIVNVVTREATKNSTEVVSDLGTWSNLGNTSWGVQVQNYSVPAEGQSLAFSMGYRKSDGAGNGESRLYGNSSWPGVPKGGTGGPADGSAWETPGDWRTSIDWKLGEFRLYARATHQVSEAGPFFVLDPWPNIGGSPDSTAPNVLIDGKTVTYKDPFWSSTESYACNRREYVADNVMADASYTQTLGEDQLKYHAAFDGNTDRIQHEMRPGYESANLAERNSFIDETFGERRYTFGAVYLLKRIPKLQLALGGEQRFDDIGNDLSGKNSQGEKATHKIVSDVLYTNTAIFSEGYYDINDKLGADFGLRWDGHTRTIDNGGTVNGKLALVYSLMPGHTIKLIGQSSSNNGSADNYEYGRNNFNDQGVPYTTAHYEKPNQLPGAQTTAIPGVTSDLLHELKPEKVYSFELTSTHQITPEIMVAPSASYNMVRDLFAWNQGLFRVVNAGEYNHLDLEAEASYTTKFLTVGINHAFQIPINTDVASQSVVFTVDRFTRDSIAPNAKDPSKLDTIQWPNYIMTVNGKDTTYTPVKNGTTTNSVNPVADQITADGNNFLSLATNATKLYVDVHPLSWVTFHTDARIFWGLAGRDSEMVADSKAGYNVLGVNTDAMVKWDASVHFSLPQNLSIGLYAYNILGTNNPNSDLAIHSIRWQQQGDGNQKDLYGVDLRSFALDVKKSF